jgi:hypothetical protein
MTLATLCFSACDSDDEEAIVAITQHGIFFVGYVFDGSSDRRLATAEIASVTIRYRDQTIATVVEPDGRFVATAPLPTWQDYTVTIDATGFRRFVSHNPGIDVPAALAMTDGLAGTSTEQTFHFEARLFPTALVAPAFSITVTQSDALSSMPAPAPPAGNAIFRPTGPSLLERQTSQAGTRLWFNDEDLSTRTVNKTFTGGKIDITAGELLYGVTYDLTIFNVPGYQPSSAGSNRIVAGSVGGRTIKLEKALQDPLQILSIDAAECMPPAGTLADFGARISVTFNQNVEFVGPTWAEELDNSVTVTPSSGFVPGSFSMRYCGLKTGPDPTMRERGTKVTAEATKIVFSWNPAVGMAANEISLPCVLPPTFTSVNYAVPSTILVQPMGDTTRRLGLGSLISEYNRQVGQSQSSAVRCGAVASQF